jgi:exopolyphosphatase/guanosine-5'-triphosphate,3'-diphosphate pyrophosphatase
MPAAQALAAVGQLRRLGLQGIGRHPCIGAERAAFVLPGCAIFAALHAMWPAAEILVADRGLREGMVARLIRADRQKADRPPGSAGHGRAGPRRPPVPPALAAGPGPG